MQTFLRHFLEIPKGSATICCASVKPGLSSLFCNKQIGQEQAITLYSRCDGETCVCDMVLRDWKYIETRSKSNPLCFSQEISCFWNIFVSFRSKVWSGEKRDVKANNTLCMALFQSKKPLVGLTSAGKKARSLARVVSCSHLTLFKLHHVFFYLGVSFSHVRIEALAYKAYLMHGKCFGIFEGEKDKSLN